jgi:hypothetical protein
VQLRCIKGTESLLPPFLHRHIQGDPQGRRMKWAGEI